jgi:hypothetical protein
MTAHDLEALVSGTDGPVPVTETVTIRNTFGLVMDFKCRELEWLGPPDKPMFLLSRADGCAFKNLEVWAERPGLAVFAVTNHPPDADGFTSTNNRFEDIKGYIPGLRFGSTVDHRIGGGGDANNDRMTYTRCEFHRATDAAFHFYGTQSMLHRLTDCNAHGNYVTKNFLRHDHSHAVAAIGCGGGSLTDYAFQLGPLTNGHAEITGGAWEMTRGGLVRVSGNFVTPVQLTIQRVRFDQKGGSDFVIDLERQVPSIVVEDCLFDVNPDAGVLRPFRCRVESHPAAQVASFTFNRNCVFHRKVGAPRPEFLLSPNIKHRYGGGNQYWEYQMPKGVLVVPPGPRF